jgi:hypothetical protein
MVNQIMTSAMSRSAENNKLFDVDLIQSMIKQAKEKLNN